MYRAPQKSTLSRALALVITTVTVLDVRLCSAEVSYSFGQKEPVEFIQLLKSKVSRVEKDIWGDVVVSIGQDGLIKALETKENNVAAAFISRGEYESVIGKYKRRDVSVLFFDPSPENMHRLADTVVKNSVGAPHRIAILASQSSEDWFSSIKGVDTRVRKNDDPPNVLLKGNVTQHLFLIPADNDLVKGVSFADLITTLLEKGTGIIGFSPYLKNTAANVYFDPNEYAMEFALALKYSEGNFRKYPSNPKYAINNKILSAIGIRYKGSLEGDLGDE